LEARVQLDMVLLSGGGPGISNYLDALLVDSDDEVRVPVLSSYTTDGEGFWWGFVFYRGTGGGIKSKMVFREGSPSNGAGFVSIESMDLDIGLGELSTVCRDVALVYDEGNGAEFRFYVGGVEVGREVLNGSWRPRLDVGGPYLHFGFSRLGPQSGSAIDMSMRDLASLEDVLPCDSRAGMSLSMNQVKIWGGVGGMSDLGSFLGRPAAAVTLGLLHFWPMDEGLGGQMADVVLAGAHAVVGEEPSAFAGGFFVS